MFVARPTSFALLLALSASVAGAQTAATQAATDYRSETVAEIDARAQKYIALAEAIPADKYTWRPAEGVRSVSEVLMHMAGANYFLPARPYGAAIPEGLQLQGFETSTTDKEAVLKHLRESFTHLRNAVANAPADAEAKHQWFGGASLSNRAIGMSIAAHMGEHLGQLIAYARVNGVRPPWSGEG